MSAPTNNLPSFGTVGLDAPAGGISTVSIARDFGYPSRSVTHIPWYGPTHQTPLRITKTEDLRSTKSLTYTAPSSQNFSSVDLDALSMSDSSISTYEVDGFWKMNLMGKFFAIVKTFGYLKKKALSYAWNNRAQAA